MAATSDPFAAYRQNPFYQPINQPVSRPPSTPVSTSPQGVNVNPFGGQPVMSTPLYPSYQNFGGGNYGGNAGGGVGVAGGGGVGGVPGQKVAEADAKAAESERLKKLANENQIILVKKGEHVTTTPKQYKSVILEERGDWTGPKGEKYTGKQVAQMTFEQKKSEARVGAELRAGGKLTKFSPTGWEYESAPAPRLGQPVSMLNAGSSMGFRLPSVNAPPIRSGKQTVSGLYTDPYKVTYDTSAGTISKITKHDVSQRITRQEGFLQTGYMNLAAGFGGEQKLGASFSEMAAQGFSLPLVTSQAVTYGVKGVKPEAVAVAGVETAMMFTPVFGRGLGLLRKSPKVVSIASGTYGKLGKLEGFGLTKLNVVSRVATKIPKTFTSKAVGMFENPKNEWLASKGAAFVKTIDAEKAKVYYSVQKNIARKLSQVNNEARYLVIGKSAGIKQAGKTEFLFKQLKTAKAKPFIGGFQEWRLEGDKVVSVGKTITQNKWRGNQVGDVMTFLRPEAKATEPYGGSASALVFRGGGSAATAQAQAVTKGISKQLAKQFAEPILPKLSTGVMVPRLQLPAAKKTTVQIQTRSFAAAPIQVQRQGTGILSFSGQATKQSMKPATFQVQRPMQLQRVSTGQATAQSQVQKQVQRQAQQQRQATEQVQKQQQRTVQRTAQRTQTRTLFGTPFPPYVPTPSVPIIPRIPPNFGFTEGGGFRQRQYRGKYGYTPSVGAMLFGITATRRPAVIGEIRPIIVPRGRRKPKPMWDISGFKKGRL